VKYAMWLQHCLIFHIRKKKCDIVKAAKEGWYCATVMSYSSAMKFDIEKLDGSIKDVLIQSGLHKVLTCGVYGHLKRNCLGGEVPKKDHKASASNFSLILGDNGDLI